MIALQLQVTALIAVLAEKAVIDHSAYLHLCRYMMASQQEGQPDLDWAFVKRVIEGQFA